MALAAQAGTVELTERLATRVLQVVERWRAHERHTLGGQLARAALSVSCNLVEATSRRSARERLRFVEIADGSLRETGHLLDVARRTGLVRPEVAEELGELHAGAKRIVARRRAAEARAVRGAAKDARRAPAGSALPGRKPAGRIPHPVSRARKKKPNATQLRLRPADPFELIRWLARSQNDPRKAVAELVQNSLDAGARHVEVHRQRVRRQLCVVVRDDGEGVLPELEREEALRYLATHVGHSRKLGLDPAERARRVVAGKYGVGLLGFWSVGRHLELRTRVGGSRAFVLRLGEDSPQAEILPLPLRTDSPDTYTEAVVLDVHAAAQRALGGRRLSDYLAAELRGHLLAREVDLTVHDHVARGLAQKRFDVVPRRYAGEPLSLPAEVEVDGHAPLRVELYLARGAERPAVQVACGGTLVADDFSGLDALGVVHEPWVGRDITGILDFPSFSVPPGTRRGVAPDYAAAAFVEALGRLEPLVHAELDRLEAERRSSADREVVRELQRALRGLRRRLPRYDLPHIEGRSEPDGANGPGARLDAEGASDGSTATSRADDLPLFPPGPLASVRIVPAEVAIAAGGERRVRAEALDRDGRAAEEALYAWRVADTFGVGVSLRGEGARATMSVRAGAPVGATAELHVEASAAGLTADAAARITVVEPDDDRAGLGIPEPFLVGDVGGSWRSRMAGERWEVNEAHEDYVAVRGDTKARVRYLLALLAREIVLRTAGRPEVAEPLDGMVEILAHAERNLRGA